MNQPPQQTQATAQTAPMNFVDERYLKSELAGVEARTDVKFAELMGELKVISTNVLHLGSQICEIKVEIVGVKSATASVKWNLLTTGLAIGGLILGLFAYGQQMFQIAESLFGLKH